MRRFLSPIFLNMNSWVTSMPSGTVPASYTVFPTCTLGDAWHESSMSTMIVRLRINMPVYLEVFTMNPPPFSASIKYFPFPEGIWSSLCEPVDFSGSAAYILRMRGKLEHPRGLIELISVEVERIDTEYRELWLSFEYTCPGGEYKSAMVLPISNSKEMANFFSRNSSARPSIFPK